MLAVFGTAALGYAAASYVLLRHPQLLHGKKRDDRNKRVVPRCVHISHRGGAGEGYENTISAFKKAKELHGTDMLELDCHLTADGVVIVAHDLDLKRITGVKGKVGECNVAPGGKHCIHF